MRYILAFLAFAASLFVVCDTAHATTIYSPTITGYYQATNEAMYSATPYTPGTETTNYVAGSLSQPLPIGGYMSGYIDLTGLTVGDYIYITYGNIPGSDTTMATVKVTSPTMTVNFAGINEMSFYTASCVEVYTYPHQGFAVQDIHINSALPSTPSGLTVGSITSSGGVASWGSIANATSYTVYLDGKQIATTTGTSYTLTGLQGNSNHYVQVTSSDSAGTSSLSNPYSFTTAPSAPTGLNATNVTYNSLTLNWTASPGATSYLVFENGSKIGTASGTSYNVTGLSGNTGYSFYVEAQSTYTSGPSQAFTVTTALPPMPAPTGVNSSGTSGGNGTISWTPGTGTPSGTTYTVLQNGTPIGTTTGTSLSVSNYDPNAVYTVTASASGYTSASGNYSLTSGMNTTFGAGDLFTNTALLLWSIGSFLLLALIFYVAPKFINLLKRTLKTNQKKEKYAIRNVSANMRPKREFTRTISPYRDNKHYKYTIHQESLRTISEPVRQVKSDSVSDDISTSVIAKTNRPIKTGYDYGFNLED